MAVYSFPEGIWSANNGGHLVATGTPCVGTRRVWYVSGDHANASDNSSTHGSAEDPLDTVYYAYVTAASAGDLIVVAAGHIETMTTILTMNKVGVGIIGGGSGSSRPIFQGSEAASEGQVCNLTAVGNSWTNCLFRKTPATELNVLPIMDVNAEHCRLIGCWFQDRGIGATSLGAVRVGNTSGASWFWIDECDFTNSAASESVSCVGAVFLAATSAANLTGFRATGCTFDGGTYGYETGAIYCTVAAVGWWIQECTLEDGADISFTHADARGICVGNTYGDNCFLQVPRLREFHAGLVAESESSDPALYLPNFQTTGAVYWVDSTRGSDTASGTERDRPLATYAAAYALAVAGDVILIEAAHSQTLTAEQALSTARVYTFGIGTGTSLPTFAQSTNGQGVFLLSANGAELHNIRFTASALAAQTQDRVRVNATGCRVSGCYFACGAADVVSLDLESGAIGAVIEGNTFQVTAAQLTTSIACRSQVGTNGGGLIRDNYFTGSSSYAAWGVAAFQGTETSIVGAKLVLGNTLTNKARIVESASCVGCIYVDNEMDDSCRLEIV